MNYKKLGFLSSKDLTILKINNNDNVTIIIEKAGQSENSGFLPEERDWMTGLFGGQAWANNVGWRIDYHVATKGIAGTAQSASIYKEQRFSDHAPLIIKYA